jgi:putative transposase
MRAHREITCHGLPQAQWHPAGVPGKAAGPAERAAAGEREEVLAVLDSPRFRDKAPRQVWALLIDEGTYLASVSTMYRLLRDAGQVRERRAQAAHPARKKPELMAAGPNEVRSWDITKLAGPRRGVYYHLYVMTGIFSRCAVHSEVHATELGELAKDFITEAVRLNRGIAPHAIHADRGTSMTSKTVPALLSDLAILKSHSRPKVSNDNPCSEAQFKTLKYCPAFPGTFGSLQDARAFCAAFFTYYNHEHRHSGIGLHTPYSMHIGTAPAIQDRRQAVLNAACAANPRRFTRRPRPPELPAAAWINKPVTEPDITQHSSRKAA